MKAYLTLISLVIITFFACRSDRDNTFEAEPILPEQAFDYMSIMEEVADFKLPESIPGANGRIFIDNFINNPDLPGGIPGFITTNITSNEQATLGRVLFYDARLSRNNSISCASCHKQDNAFADNADFSVGFGGEKTERNAMAIANPIINNSFFWDSREGSLARLTLQPIKNHIEMGIENMGDLIEKLEKEAFYQDLFEKAFDEPGISEQKISSSMAQFIASIFKSDAPFDKAIDSDFASFTEKEKLGMGLFFSEENKCASCHSGANFMAQDGFEGEYQSTGGTVNNGLPILNNDFGQVDGQFKIPSLRNIALTAPYMHDGRFETLAEVLHFYNSEVQPHPNLDDKLHEGGVPHKLGLTDFELEALEAFLNTLTSESITTDQRFSNPFVD